MSVSMISDSKLVPIAFIDVASRLLLPPPLVSFCEGKDHAVSAALAPFLLISLKSGAHEQRRDLVVIFEVSKETLPHFFFQGSSIKTVRVHARRLRILKSHIPKQNTKGTSTSHPQNVINISYCMCSRQADEESMAAVPPGCDQ